ncbi:kelch domain containing 4 [Perkinsus olseni]|uniref:Kelch domain containing 4 n=2 Tax=Perkinsus olseni TaxID=32597 RepID=A0A7J6SP92_PEROL|nr:kelch domain containing 4 [Perkinsus olseni]
MERKRWYVLDYKLGQKKPQEKKSRRNREGKSSKANTSTFAASVSDPTESLSAEEEEEDETAKFEWQFEYVDENGQLVTMIIPEEDRTSSEESDEDQRTPAATPTRRAEVEEPIATPEVLRARRAEGLATVQEEEACPTLIDEKGNEEKQATPEAGATGLGKMTAAEALKTGNVDLPVERINSALLVKGHTLIVYGGLREVDGIDGSGGARCGRLQYGDREVTFDDCWSLDLRQRTKWTCLLKGTMSEQKWMGESWSGEELGWDIRAGSDDELSDDDEGEEGDGDFDAADWSSSGESSDEDEEVEEAEQLQQQQQQEKKKKASSRKSAKLRERMEDIRSQWDLKEEYTPRLEESLRDFTKRTMDHWAEVQEAKMIEEAGDMDNAELRRAIMDRKEVRRLAFSLAEERFNEVRDVLVELKEMEEEQAACEEDDDTHHHHHHHHKHKSGKSGSKMEKRDGSQYRSGPTAEQGVVFYLRTAHWMIPELRGVNAEKLLQIIASTSSSTLTQSEYVYLTVALNRASKAASRPRSGEWEDTVGEWLRNHAGRMPVRQTTLTMNALARAGAGDSCGWIGESLKALLDHTGDLVAQDLSLALNAAAKVLADENKRPAGGVPEEVLSLCEEVLCRALPRLAKDLAPQGFANVLHACAKLKIRPSTLIVVEKFCIGPLLRGSDSANPLLGMNRQELSLLIYSLSRLFPPSNGSVRAVFEFAAPIVTSNESLKGMQVSELVMILHSFEKANFIPEDGIIKRLSYFTAPVVDKMSIAELANVGKFFVGCGAPDYSFLMECSRRLRCMPEHQLRSAQNLSLLMGIYAKALVRDAPLVCGVLLAAFMSCKNPDPPSVARTLLAISRLDLVRNIDKSHRQNLLRLARRSLASSDQHSLVCLAYALCTPGWDIGIGLVHDALLLAAEPLVLHKPTFGPQLAVAMQVAGITASELTLRRLRSLAWLWDASSDVSRSGEGLDALRLSAVQEEVTLTVQRVLVDDGGATLEREALVNGIWGCDLLLKSSSHG